MSLLRENHGINGIYGDVELTAEGAFSGSVKVNLCLFLGGFFLIKQNIT